MSGLTPKQQKVRVVVRVRPLQERELSSGRAVNVQNNTARVRNSRNDREMLEYSFDTVYAEEDGQERIFDCELRDRLNSVVQGRLLTVFAYGPTGAGKTHTMQGSAQAPGLIPRSVEQLLNQCRGSTTTLTMSVLEIYQEKVYDLLGASTTTGDLAIREDAKRGIFVAGLTSHVFGDSATFSQLYSQAMRNRSVAATALNSHSSRSHAIVSITATTELPATTSDDGRTVTSRTRIGKLALIDLAGSEDNRRTANAGERMRESGAINRSLFVLNHVIDALNRGEARIPYRDSKLTRMLQDALGGRSESVMIANVSPAGSAYSDTNTTLAWASKSRLIVNERAPEMTVETKRTVATENDSASAVAKIKKRKVASGLERVALGDVSNVGKKKSAAVMGGGAQRVLLKGTTGKVQEKTKKRRLRDSGIAMESDDEADEDDDEYVPSSDEEAELAVAARKRPAKKRARTEGEEGITMGEELREKTAMEAEEGSLPTIAVDPQLRTVLETHLLGVLNTGAVKALTKLSGIGKKRAEAIVASRETDGPWGSLAQLTRVDGLSPNFVASFLRNNIACVLRL